MIPVLLMLHEADAHTGALDLATECGWHLVRNAREQTAGLGWVPDANDSSPAFVGMGHGASGIASSLVSLFQATGEAAFQRVATDALLYERNLFNESGGDWPDLRRPIATNDQTAHPRIAAWCHGAAGVGIARCRIAREFPHPSILEEIRTALDLTLEVGFGNNHSLCHGDLGNLDLLLEAGTVLGDNRIGNARLELAASIVSDIADNGYRTGITHGVDSVDLMRGVAGIGFGLLRITSPTDVPSVLMLDGPRRLDARP